MTVNWEGGSLPHPDSNPSGQNSDDNRPTRENSQLGDKLISALSWSVKVLWETYIFPPDLLRWIKKNQTTRARALLAKDPAMKDWTKRFKYIPIQSSPNDRNNQTYQAVIEQFNVENSKRYKKTRKGKNKYETYCNIFAQDVMAGMGAPLPRLATTDLLAYLLSSNSANPGWHQADVNTTENLKLIVGWLNTGHPMLVLAEGHMAVLRPNQPGKLKSIWELRIAQAGLHSYNDTSLNYGWARKSNPQLYFFWHE
jgi:hypothetical protein